MKISIYFNSFLFISFFLLFVLDAFSASPVSEVCFKSHCFNVEIADTPAQMARGLQHRKQLHPKSGMLFTFPDSRIHTFWMKDTLIPLDLIWMDEHKKVVLVLENVPPCKADPCPQYNPRIASRYVLEINAGIARKLGISRGEKATFRF